ncbi:glycosyltransferase [Enterococcus faecium]|uniref:glycosyltransferase n=1 Tax=Enterococcus faecium TaxID=1352 RepID=UPI0010C01182|nr:glycosyltransferase [Enterococcus faecium]MBD9744050.1 glycosyltransferase [Enterococcus faecium]TKN32921.1 glycosyltransferase [Enterococcus faecium]TKO85352.1 glycosyltransferase [Enterococcus faecium]
MKNTIFLANIEYSKSSGIFKKIYVQSKVISKMSSCYLVCKKQTHIYIIEFKNGEVLSKNIINIKPSIRNMLSEVKKIVKEKNICRIYFRSTLKPSFKQVIFFHFLYRRGIKIYYEIPTYPYFMEQVNASNNKIFTFVKLMYEKIIFQLSYFYIYKVLVVISKNNVRRKKKFVEITNGVELNRFQIILPTNSLPQKKITFIGVGTLYNYHGYSRLIKAIGEFYKKNNEYIIVFNIVGNGPAIGDLKKYVEVLGLEDNVIFHGVLHGRKLDDLFSKADIGVGALALYERNADIDTTLKVVEYISRGLPVITSGVLKSIEHREMVFQVDNCDTVINLSRIINEYHHFKEVVTIDLLEENRKNFDWSIIMEKVFNDK